MKKKKPETIKNTENLKKKKICRMQYFNLIFL